MTQQTQVGGLIRSLQIIVVGKNVISFDEHLRSSRRVRADVVWRIAIWVVGGDDWLRSSAIEQ